MFIRFVNTNRVYVKSVSITTGLYLSLFVLLIIAEENAQNVIIYT